MKDYKLYLFDLDGTLADRDRRTLYPDAAQWITDNPDTWMIVTNQGGVGLRHWMETEGFGNPAEYPTEGEIWERLKALFSDDYHRILVAFAYQSKKSSQWSPTPETDRQSLSWRRDWRKPSGSMLLHAMDRCNVAPEQTLMVGDSDEDQQAAAAAGCDFIWAHEFFGREVPGASDTFRVGDALDDSSKRLG